MGNLAERVGTRASAYAPGLGFDDIVRSPAVFIDSLPIGIYVCDRSGVLTQYNGRAAEIWGHSPPVGDPGIRFTGALKVFHPDGAPVPADETPMAEALRSGSAVRDRELVIERPNGTRLTVVANVNPMFDESGMLVGGVNCFQDVTELRQIQNEQREGRQVFVNIMNALPSAVYATDPDGHLTYYNEAAAKMWGFEPELRKQQWCGSWKIYSSDGRLIPHEECPMAIALKERRPIRGIEAVAERPDGTRVPFLPYPTPLFGSDGNLIGGVNLLYDLTDVKKAEAQQKALIDELNHRVKNTLATVQSLAAQTFRGTDTADAAKQAFEARLLALSKTHDHLTRERWEWADLKAIVDDTLAPYRASQTHREGGPVRIAPKAALTLSMVMHELATNAAKYGALSAPDGKLAVTWSCTQEGGKRHLRLEWHESDGPTVTPPVRKGFGSKLVERSIVQDLGGSAQIAFDPSGLRYTCDVVLAG